jgi:NAD(P)-dependent dehydrogenase (short-subunit alcohol dehydrogenase family)
MDLSNRVAVITGAASGIGAACARAFAAKGARVVVVDLNAAGAESLAREIGGLAIVCDIGSEAQVDALVARTQRELGPIDVFSSNAAVATGSDPLTTPIEVWNQQWQISVMSHVYAVRSGAAGHARTRPGLPAAHGLDGRHPTSVGNLPYATTKHAVVGLAEWLSITDHDQGIRVSLLAPLGVRTPMLEPTDSAFARNFAGPIKEPEEVA